MPTPPPDPRDPDKRHPDAPIDKDDIPDTPPTEPEPAPIRDPRPEHTPPGPLIA